MAIMALFGVVILAYTAKKGYDWYYGKAKQQNTRTDVNSRSAGDPLRSSSTTDTNSLALGDLNSVPYEIYPINTNTIRRLVLDSNFSLEEIHFRFKILSLTSTAKQNSSYDALSYTWGDVHTNRRVWIEGVQVTVSDNLYQALSNLRKSGLLCVGQHIWIDQLCINQKDKAELNRAIFQQHLVYKNARRVLVWLGPSSSDSIIAMRSMQTDATQRFIESKSVDWTRIGPGLVYGREWWNRTWTVQEAMLAQFPVLCCGDGYISFDAFMSVMEYSWKNNIKIFPPRKGVAGQVGPDIYRPSLMQFNGLREEIENSNTPPISECIFRFYQQKCKEERDHFYGYLGFASPSFLRNLRIDVTLDPVEVFIDATLAVLEKECSLDFICLGHGPNRRQNSSEKPLLPSWVPDLAADTTRLARPMPLNYCRKPAFNASAGRSPFQLVTFSRHREGLLLHGNRVATIDQITGVNRHDEAVYRAMYNSNRSPIDTVHETWFESSADMANRAVDTLRSNGKQSPYSISENGIADAFWRTMTCDMRPSGERQGANMDGIMNVALSKAVPDDFHPEESNYERATSWQWLRNQEKYWWTNGRRFMITKQGHYGIVPWNADSGDTIFIIDGASVPFVLRSSDSNSWTLIGECYLHGFMDGEAEFKVPTSPDRLVLV